MRQFKSLLFAMVVLLSSTAASANNLGKEPKTYKATFTEILEDIDFNKYEVPGDRLYIEFMVNEDKQLIILATSAQDVDAKLKQMANYTELKAEGLVPFQKYTIKVTIDRK